MSKKIDIQTDKEQTKDDSTYDHIIKYTGLFGGVQGLTMLMSIVRNKIGAVLLGPAGLALINIYNNVTRLINESTNFGISFSAIKHIAELYDTNDMERIAKFACTVRTWSLLTALFGTLICLTFAPWISLWTFENYDYTTTFMLLAPIVGLMSLMGGELAILKGTKRLKKIALISVFSALSMLVVCTICYILFHIDGIVLALLLSNIIIFAIYLHYSNQVIPWKSSIRSAAVIKSGVPMVVLGVGYIIAGIFGQGAEYVIRTLILHFGKLEDVGLYNSGYILAISYASIIFSAIEADFFPRLSASGNNLQRQNQTINQQIEVCTLLISPILVLFVLAMPLVVRALFTTEFMASVPMAICAILFMFFKALTLPVAYLPLAKGDSKIYMLTELIYDIFVALAVPYAFKYWGLMGAGSALSVGGFLDMLIIHSFYRYRYHYRFNKAKLGIYFIQFILLLSVILLSLQAPSLYKWIGGVLAFILTLYISLHILSKETNIISTLKKKLRRK